jgi:glycosyltransferase involved in cell wall biosynthesis
LILNEGMVDEALAQGFTRQQLLWMPNPVDVREFMPSVDRERLRQQAGVGDDPVLLFVGRLSPEKNLPVLLEAFAQCGVPAARLVLVGDGPQRAELEAQAARLGMAQRVHFAGRLPMDEVLRWMQSADVFALLSRLEGFPCALVEAMAVGLPSVVSAIPGNQQLVEDGRQGFVVPTGDASATALKLGELLNDPVACRNMGAAARQLVVEKYSSGQVAQRYEQLFDEVRAGRQERMGA